MEISYFDNQGNFISYHPAVDADGRQVERTKDKYPYSYDAFVTFQKRKPSKKTSVVYSDRIVQWDNKKARKLMKKHFKTTGDYYYDRKPEEIEAFLRDYFSEPSIELIYIMEGCNVSSGFPYWVFGFEKK
jgi:hypothetical protein